MKKLSELEIDNFICPKYFFHVFGLNSDVNLGVGRLLLGSTRGCLTTRDNKEGFDHGFICPNLFK